MSDTTQAQIIKLKADFGDMVFKFFILVFSIFWTSFVASVLWSWFVTPVFQVNAPGLATMYGIILFVKLVSYKDLNSNVETNKKKDYSKRVVFNLIFPTVMLLFGWIAHLFQ
jgi:hypothetical protein